jgi:hypothetical protein
MVRRVSEARFLQAQRDILRCGNAAADSSDRRAGQMIGVRHGDRIRALRLIQPVAILSGCVGAECQRETGAALHKDPGAVKGSRMDIADACSGHDACQQPLIGRRIDLHDYRHRCTLGSRIVAADQQGARVSARLSHWRVDGIPRQLNVLRVILQQRAGNG